MGVAYDPEERVAEGRLHSSRLATPVRIEGRAPGHYKLDSTLAEMELVGSVEICHILMDAFSPGGNHRIIAKEGHIIIEAIEG